MTMTGPEIKQKIDAIYSRMTEELLRGDFILNVDLQADQLEVERLQSLCPHGKTNSEGACVYCGKIVE